MFFTDTPVATTILISTMLLSACGGGNTPPEVQQQLISIGAAQTDITTEGIPATEFPVEEIDTVSAAPEAFSIWQNDVQPKIENQCGDCHLGQRFGFASLEKEGSEFSADETEVNYREFLSLLSLDSSQNSRLFAKTLQGPGNSHPLKHGGGKSLQESDELFQSINTWIDAEQKERCPDCGLSANKAYIAYIDQPSIHWALDRAPTQADIPSRSGARLMLREIDPATLQPVAEPIDFLPQSFCPTDGICDLGRVAANHRGDELVFECRLPAENKTTDQNELAWNLCIAGISPQGTALNPRFLRPAGERHEGFTVTRSDAYGIRDDNGYPSRGKYDLHFRMRQTDDTFPVYSPDDRRITFSSRSADPRTGVIATRSYHGAEFTNNIISTDLEGNNAKTLYLNEGGLADAPLYLRNGNLAFHVWNLERMDRHLYVQSTADGMMEMPVLFGRTQGRNMWGPITQLSNGSLIGTTGHRRGSVSLFVPFHTDHTIGLGLDPEFPGFSILDPAIVAEMDEQFAYCDDPPNGKNCFTSRFYADPAYSPDGRALISYHPGKTHYGQDDNSMYLWYRNKGIETAVQDHVPELEIALMDQNGTTTSLLQPSAGRSYRYPVYVGKRWAPLAQPVVTDETANHAEIHIADFPLWLSFREQQSKSRKRFVEDKLDKIVAVRVLVKQLGNNSCTNDGKTYRRSTYDTYDHPTHLGSNNATGYDQLFLPTEQGGDGFGNIPLLADKSVRLRVPAGVPLLFQGIDAAGHMVSQHSRVFALPPGHTINTSVKRTQHDAQCGSCHGTVTGNEFTTFSQTALLPATMDFNTLATSPKNLTNVARRNISFLELLRPILDNTCVSCHSGTQPAARLTFTDTYSPTANAPHEHWEYALQTDDTIGESGGSGAGEGYANYLASIPQNLIVRGYNWSPARDFVLREGDIYLDTFVNNVQPASPIADYAPWDPGYQMLMISQAGTDGDYRYLTDWQYQTQVGRGGDWSRTSFLLEVLTGRDLDPRNTYNGLDHSNMLSEDEIRSTMAFIKLSVLRLALLVPIN